MELEFGSVSERGLNPRRPVNQDRLLVVPERNIFAVFDGVGGQRAGEVASETAAETIEEALEQTRGPASPEQITRAIQIANRDIFELASTRPDLRSMATTVALLQIDGDRGTIAHVGDSRVYRFEEGKLYRETIDHTDLEDQLRAGVISTKDAAARGRDNSINRALGVEPEVEVELKSIPIHDGSSFLLCSDGVYSQLSDERIAQILSRGMAAQETADELKRLVYEKGADDNLTCVVIRVGELNSRSEHREIRSRIAPNSGRIRVDLDRRQIGKPPSFSGYADESGSSGGRFARLLMYVLLIALIAGAAFYAGLRVSESTTDDRQGGSREGDTLEPGRSAFEQGDFSRAASEFAHVIDLDPANARAHYWMGRSLFEQGEYLSALQSFDQAIRLNPALAEAYLQSAAAWQASGDRVRAERMLARYAELHRSRGTSREGQSR